MQTERARMIAERDAKRAEIYKLIPGLSSWTLFDPQYPDTDLFLECLLEAYKADPGVIIANSQVDLARQMYSNREGTV